MKHLNYPTTYDQPYRGHPVHCCKYSPDILCHVDGVQFGQFWASTKAAVNAAQQHINKVIEEQETNKA